MKSKHFENLQNVLTGAAPLPLADVERFLGKVDVSNSTAYLTTTVPPPVDCCSSFKTDIAGFYKK